MRLYCDFFSARFMTEAGKFRLPILVKLVSWPMVSPNFAASVMSHALKSFDAYAPLRPYSTRVKVWMEPELCWIFMLHFRVIFHSGSFGAYFVFYLYVFFLFFFSLKEMISELFFGARYSTAKKKRKKNVWISGFFTWTAHVLENRPKQNACNIIVFFACRARIVKIYETLYLQKFFP